jgi:hypothetical protein
MGWQADETTRNSPKPIKYFLHREGRRFETVTAHQPMLRSSEGCRAEALLGEGGLSWTAQLRLGKPARR